MVRSLRRWSILVLLAMATACRAVEEPVVTSPGTGPSIEPLMPERVREIFARSCETCHGLQGHGLAGIAPDLRKIGPRTTAEWSRYLREPGKAHPVGAPPPLWLTADEIDLIARFLVTIPGTAERSAK